MSIRDRFHSFLARNKTARDFFCIVAAFFCLFLLSWPIVFSLNLWAFEDRGSFLNLENLLAQHLRLGVDTFYVYGLLPVLIQHILFSIFGKGYKPLIGCTVVTLILMAGFWALLMRYLPTEKLWLWAIVLMSPILFWVNPNFPYSLVVLSLLYSLYFVLRDRLDIALAISAIGWFSVPSLPLAMTAMLLFLILLRWATGDCSARALGKVLLPGTLTYSFLALLLTLVFGVRSVLVTSFPWLGMKFYKNMSAFATNRDFFHPSGHSALYYVGYYIGTPATWWFASTFALFVFGIVALATMIRKKRVDPKLAAVSICAVLMAAFTFAARGSMTQYVIYDPILVVGVLLGLDTVIPAGKQRVALIAFAALGIASQAAQARSTLLAWTSTQTYTNTEHLYADTVWMKEWSQILALSRDHRVMLLSYGTGVHFYFPTIVSPDTWFLLRGEVFPSDEARVMKQLKEADIVVEDIDDAHGFIDHDPAIQAELGSMCMTEATEHFRTWWRHPDGSATCRKLRH